MTHTDPQTDLRRVRILYGVNSWMFVGVVIAVATFYEVAQAAVSPLVIDVWLVYMSMAFAYRVLTQVAFHKSASKKETFNWRRWECAFAFGLLTTATGWGVAGWLLSSSVNAETRFILAFIVAGLIAGGASAYSLSLLSTYSVMLPMVLPFCLYMLWHHGDADIAIAALAAVFMAIMLTASHKRRDFTFQAWEDAAERDRLTRELIETQAKATHSTKMAALGQMAAGIAHEINTPLAIISVYAQNLQELVSPENPDYAYVHEFSGQIDETVTRIAKIVDGLRSFSRQDQKDVPREFETSQLIDSTLELCRERFKQMGVSLTVKTPETHFRVNGYSTQLSQVLLNLLNNAADATQSLPSRWVSIETRVNASKVLEIQVTDSGSGIPKELHAKIMEPFFTTKEVGKGTGLGLSVAHGIMVAHKGSLTIDETNVNTCFVMQLPLAG